MQSVCRSARSQSFNLFQSSRFSRCNSARNVGTSFTDGSFSSLIQRFSSASISDSASAAGEDSYRHIKVKRLDKTARHIMQILDKEAVTEVKGLREVPDIRAGYDIQLKMEVPENKRRVQVVRGIVIARRNAGLNTTIRLRRTVGGVGVESLFPLYSPTIKEITVLKKYKVRQSKLYILRKDDKALKKM